MSSASAAPHDSVVHRIFREGSTVRVRVSGDVDEGYRVLEDLVWNLVAQAEVLPNEPRVRQFSSSLNLTGCDRHQAEGMGSFFLAPARVMKPTVELLFSTHLQTLTLTAIQSQRCQNLAFSALSGPGLATGPIHSRNQPFRQRRSNSTDQVGSTSNLPMTKSEDDVAASAPGSRRLAQLSDAEDALPPLPDLPSQAERRRTLASKRFTHLMDHLQSQIFIASQRLNDLTGYSGIEALKASIDAQESMASETRALVKAAKDAYTTAIAQRSASQREVNELLQRKSGWSPTDLERFTELYRSDHANEQAEQAACDALAVAEAEAEEIASRLSKSILARYHEEQIWSDKIRRMSTWGTWGLMGVNILLFVIFQVAVEPWRRRRLVSGFEDKVREAFEKGVGGINASQMLVTEAVDGESSAVTPEVPITESTTPPTTQDSMYWEPPPLPPSLTLTTPDPISSPIDSGTSLTPMERLKYSAADLISNRNITVRKIDLTTIVLESVAAGAAFVGVACWLLVSRR